jgi:cytochrome c-type biogenesis protein CcmE
MTRIRTKLIITLLVIGGAVGYLVQAGVRTGWVYSMDADAFLEKTEFHSRRVRLSGSVGLENVEANRAGLYAKFDLVSNDQSVRVDYRGAVPDMFKPGHEVVVEGKLDDAGVFQADVLLTKCASKYDQASPHAQNEMEGDEPYGGDDQ